MSLNADRKLRKFIPEDPKELWRGKIVEVNGSPTVSGNPLFCWVRPDGGGQPLAIYNDAVLHKKGRRVVVGRDRIDKRVRVLRGVYISGMTQVVNFNVGPHGSSHGPDGDDVVYLDAWQILNLRVYPTTGMNVHFNGGYIVYQGHPLWAVPDDISLTDSIPESGARYSLIRVSSAGAIDVQDGDPVDSYIDLTDSDIPECETGYAVIAFVRLYYGQTALSKLVTNPDVKMLIWGGGLFDVGEFDPEEHGHVEISMYNVSNPPTETQLIAAFGTPDEFTEDGKIGLVNDAATGSSAYVVLSDGGHFWLLPLTKAAETTIGVSVASSVTIAEETNQWFGRAALERLDSGIWVLCYKEASAHAENDGALHIRFSDDNGATWSDEDKYLDDTAISGFPMNPTGAGEDEDAGEPWLYVAPNGNLILHMWRVDYGVSANGTYQSISTDDGLTWSASAQINFTGIADDAKVFATDDHFVLNGVIYAGARQVDDAALTNTKSIFIKSADNGTTWELVSTITDFVNYPTEEIGLEYIGNDTIIAILRDDDNTVTYKTVSTDLGENWSALEDITATFEAAGRIRIKTRAHLKGFENWWTDSVLIAYGFQLMDPGNSYQRRNAVWISQDRGVTWDGPNYADVEVEDAGYADMLYNPTDNLWVMISYQGEQIEADLKQYNLEITGI